MLGYVDNSLVYNGFFLAWFFSMFYPLIVWLLGASFFFYKYLVQVSPSVMTNDLMQAFNVRALGLGNLSACYFYAYLIMQIPVGVLLDKYSPRYLTACAIFLCAIGTFLFAETHSLTFACLSRGLIGFGAAFAAVSCFKSAANWFAPKRFALVSGMYMTAAMLGGVGGQAPLAWLVRGYGWRLSLQLIAIAGILLAVLYVLLVRDKAHAEQHTSIVTPAWSLNFQQIFVHPQAWLLSIYSGLAFAPVSVFGGLWGVPFLQQAYAFSAPKAAFAVSWIFIGFALGAPILGWFSDYIMRRKPVMLFGTVVALCSLMTVLYGFTTSSFAACLALAVFGFGASGFFISFSMIRELFPFALTATVLGFMNTFDALCEAVSEPIVGVFLDWGWKGQSVNGVVQFSTHAYQCALSLLPGYFLLALLVLSFIHETHCKAKGD